MCKQFKANNCAALWTPCINPAGTINFTGGGGFSWGRKNT